MKCERCCAIALKLNEMKNGREKEKKKKTETSKLSEKLYEDGS